MVQRCTTVLQLCLVLRGSLGRAVTYNANILASTAAYYFGQDVYRGFTPFGKISTRQRA